MVVKERYDPKVVDVDTTLPIAGDQIGVFACVTAGTITVTNSEGGTVLDEFPVEAGTVYFLPLRLGPNGGTFTTAGGASGTVGT